MHVLFPLGVSLLESVLVGSAELELASQQHVVSPAVGSHHGTCSAHNPDVTVRSDGTVH